MMPGRTSHGREVNLSLAAANVPDMYNTQALSEVCKIEHYFGEDSIEGLFKANGASEISKGRCAHPLQCQFTEAAHLPFSLTSPQRLVTV
jgi:hypothetical protein